MSYKEEAKEILKKWGIVKNRKHLQLFYEIAPETFPEKVAEYGKLFSEDLSHILRLRDEKAIVRFLKRARSKRNQILIADTYLAIRKGFQTIIDQCEDRLLNLCTIKNEDCNILICPKAKEFKNLFS